MPAFAAARSVGLFQGVVAVTSSVGGDRVLSSAIPTASVAARSRDAITVLAAAMVGEAPLCGVGPPATSER